MALHAGHKLYTSADLRALEALPENADKKFELIAGEIFEVTTGTPEHAFIILLLASKLLQFVLNHDLGFVFTDTVTYQLSEEHEYIPDVSYISRESQAELPPKRYYVAPDLAVEVMSPSNQPQDMLRKIETYFQYGTRLVWLIYPDTRTVWVYEPQADGSWRLSKTAYEGTLDGGDVLPGFSIPVREIFPPQSAA
ncbi:MAG: hypothetical protein BroJett018_53410 [Chloroflexota bacterium]|nr:MAG: hypothetical protein BroJett018_53410 [Chloroflexota bacterium]